MILCYFICVLYSCLINIRVVAGIRRQDDQGQKVSCCLQTARPQGLAALLSEDKYWNSSVYQRQYRYISVYWVFFVLSTTIKQFNSPVSRQQKQPLHWQRFLKAIFSPFSSDLCKLIRLSITCSNLCNFVDRYYVFQIVILLN